ncbi:MAG: response regulator [Leptolyngbya sp. SIO1E4]|nr:response regulator [Leptolyngbya sp. SIO1E4]
MALIAQQMVNRQQGIRRTQMHGTVVYVAYLPLQSANWSMGLVIPQGEIENQLRLLDLMALVIVGLTSVMILILWQIQTFKQRALTKAKVAAETASRTKSEFLANMSHELRTPLNAILGMTEGLQESIFGQINPQQSEALQTINHSASHLRELINDLLDVAKIESDRMELDCQPTAVKLLCQSSLAFIQQQALKKSIQITTELPSNLPDLWVDERRIRQVLLNLLDNAVKFTPDSGQITLKVSPIKFPVDQEGRNFAPAHYLRISITDTGIGIAPNAIKKLFQPFVQIDSALNRQYAGSGLGLALVKRIVELHGGRVGVKSQVGRGSSFTVDLPCVVTAAASPISPHRPEPSSVDTRFSIQGSAPLILLAEDNEANIRTVSSFLKAKGYRTLLAKNGIEAITLAQSETPDLILIDIQMPGINGLEAIHQIRHDTTVADVPIIALTALSMAGDRERCLAAGANEYLSKPVKLKQLVITIQQCLAP